MPDTATPYRFRKLLRRAQFLACARGPKAGRSSMLVQMRPRHDSDATIGIGFTTSKKVGNAVARNRARRRLREAARLSVGGLWVAGADYVLVGRTETITADWRVLLDDLAVALQTLHRGAARHSNKSSPPRN